ncbi:hypothetical protein P5673_014292, partial [Acropora cervicornis]
DTNCLIRNLKHRCSPRSVLRTASRGLDSCGPTIELLCRLKFLDRNIANWKDRRTNSSFME